MDEQMSAVLNVIRQVMDCDGNFEMDDLVETSKLSRAAVNQAIIALRREGHAIVKMRAEPAYWQWQNAGWARKQMVEAAK